MLTIISGAAGGLALFLFGLRAVSQSLQKSTGGFTRSIMRFLTKNPLKGVFTGIFITFCTQSSSATTVLLISFVEAGLMKFSHTVAVILGADIGTSITVQLIAFRIGDYALIIAAAGFLVMTAAKYEREKFLGQAVFGFGLIFTGMMLMSEAAGPLKEIEKFSSALALLTGNPLLLLLASAFLTAVIQSSAAVLAIAITLASQGFFGPGSAEIAAAAMPVVFGANIGTCATGFIAGAQSSAEAKKVASAHLLIKLAGVLLLLPFSGVFARFTAGLSEAISPAGLNEARIIANAHTLFNLLIVFIMLPFTGFIAGATSYFSSRGGVGRSAPAPLLETPEAALSWAEGKIGLMLSTLVKMHANVAEVIKKSDRRLLENTVRMDDSIDVLNEEIVRFLTKLGQKPLSAREAGREIALIRISNRIESAADTITRDMLPACKKLMEKDLCLSFEGLSEILSIHSLGGGSLSALLDALTGRDASLLEAVSENGERFGALIEKSHLNHIRRLHKGISESYSTEQIHFHLLKGLEHINSGAEEMAEDLKKII